jgi:SNF2-related domain
LNPFKQDKIIICSYHFAKSKEPYIRQTDWDLVVIDEAHRLRNVYKPTNKIANALKNMLAPFPKVLLTATPLQNSLLELYGLVSIVDEYVFGDQYSFRDQFAGLDGDSDFAQLKKRLERVSHRTLRRQVLEYVSYTNRTSITQEFYPTEEEQKLYDLVSEYLQRDTLFALPKSQRKLMTLILRKLLASSTVGFPLTTKIETLTLAGLTVHSIQNGDLFICLEKPLTLEAIRAMADKKPARVVCLDEGFAGNDQLKTNAVQTFKSKNITFRTV